MITKKIGDFTGHSTSGLDEAIQNALQKAGDHQHFKVVETSCSHAGEHARQYEVTLTTFSE